jgi:hypothetical protein
MVDEKDQADADKFEEDEYEQAVAQRQLLIDTWNARDELYRTIFGQFTYVTPLNYGPPLAIPKEGPISKKKTEGDTGDPGMPPLEEQHLAVLAYEPDPLRPYWTYVTAGLCSPWVQQAPDEVSGFGCELLIKTPIDEPWAIQILRSMAYYILNYAGTLSPGVRIGLNSPITVNTDSKIRNIFIWYADETPDCWYILPSGGFGLFVAIGITEDELRFAESIDEYGTWCIQQVLRQTGFGQVTDPRRSSAMTHENINEINQSVRRFADNFRAPSSD